jgi:hypothetical protein
MKIKIREQDKTIIPRLQIIGISSFLSLMVKQVIKYITLPVKIKKV